MSDSWGDSHDKILKIDGKRVVGVIFVGEDSKRFGIFI